MADISGADEIARAFTAKANRAKSDVEPVMFRAGMNMKRQQQAEFRASRHFSPVASAVTFDVTSGPGYVETEVGPVKGSPGSLANIAIFGGSRGGGTVADPQGSLDNELPNAMRYLRDVIGEL